MSPVKPAVLTPEMVAELRRPFTAAAVKFKPQTVTRDKKKAMATFYIDARLVVERLNTVVGAENWFDRYEPLFHDNAQAHSAFHFPVACTLLVFDTPRVDVGIYQKDKPDELAMKSAYSDALKRAAVKFGVGAYLYALPNIWEETKLSPDGNRVYGFTDAAIVRLRKGYEAAVKRLGIGEPLDHGDVADDTPAPAEVEPDEGDRLASRAELVALGEMAKAKGVKEEDYKKLVVAHRNANGGNVLHSWLQERLSELDLMPIPDEDENPFGEPVSLDDVVPD